MVIDIDDIISYCTCPMLYKFRRDKILDNNISLLDKFDEDIRKAVFGYFALIQNNETVSLKVLNKMFITSWMGNNKSSKEILFTKPSSWRDTHEQKRKRGLKSLEIFFNHFSKDKFNPIFVNQEYTIKIDEDLYLKGRFDLIREIKGLIELIDFKVDDKLHNKIYIDKDIRITSSVYAFKKLSGKEPDVITFYGLDKNKRTRTTRKEFDWFILTVKRVARCIRENIFYACPSDKCFNCMHKNVCNNNLTYKNML